MSENNNTEKPDPVATRGRTASTCSVVETKTSVDVITLKQPTQGEGYDEGYDREMELLEKGWSYLSSMKIEDGFFIKVLFNKNQIEDLGE